MSDEMFDKWIAISLAQLGVIFLSSFVVYAAILLHTRMMGLRSFSKMTASDFAMTIAVGSLFGATISSPSPTLLMGLFAIFCVFVGQWTLAVLRRKSSFFTESIKAAITTIAVALHRGAVFASGSFQHGSSVRPSSCSWFDGLLNTEPSPPIKENIMSKRNTWRLATATVAIAAASCFASLTQANDTLTTGDGLLSLTANMPEKVRVGEEFTYSVKVANTSDDVTIHNIELKQLKPTGFSIDSTSVDSNSSQAKQAKAKKDAQGKSNSDMTIAMLKPGESKTINVKATADKEGELRSCLAIVNYMPSICLTSQVIKPELELTKTAPKQADRCDVIELEYMVKNAGSGDVGAFIVTDTLGKGMGTIDGNDTLKFDVDGLAAGDSRKFLARVYANKPGRFSSRAIAKAENSKIKSRSNETTTEVIAADLAVRVEGPNRLYGEQLAEFTAHVTNTGNAAANDVRVNIYWPEACNMVDLSKPKMQSSDQSSKKSSEQTQGEPTVVNDAGNASKDAANKNDDNVELAMSEKSMTIGRLEAGQTAVIEYAVRTGDVDTLPTKVVAHYICSVETAEDQAGAKSETVSMAMARADVVRLPATQLIVFDDEDPVLTGSNVVYSIRVWNEGDAEDSDVTLKAEIPEGLEFVSAKGPTKHSVNGATVTFEPIKTMQTGDRADYKVTAKSIGDGDVRFTAILNSKSLKKEVASEEATRLFAQKAQ